MNSRNRLAIRERNPSKTWSVIREPDVNSVTSRSISDEISDVNSQTNSYKKTVEMGFAAVELDDFITH